MENKKVEIGKSRGNQIQGVKAVIEIRHKVVLWCQLDVEELVPIPKGANLRSFIMLI